jgi:hypothetical protein
MMKCLSLTAEKHDMIRILEISSAHVADRRDEQFLKLTLAKPR